MMLANRRAPEAVRVETPEPLRELLATLYAVAGAHLYLVGGAVRDFLRGATPADLDFVVENDAPVATGCIAGAFGGHVFPMDAERGQLRVVLTAGLLRTIDVAPLKGDLVDDLAARDFTVDAMAAPLLADGQLGALIDPCGGVPDLEAQRIRMTSAAALTADPLRLLRAARLAIELGFAVEDETAAAIEANAGLLAQAAAERQRDELLRLLATPHAAAGLRLLDSLGLLAQLLPELMPARGVEQPSNHHHYDVFDHSLETVAALDELLAPDEPSEPRARTLRTVFREGGRAFDVDTYAAALTGGYSRLVLLKLAGLLHDVAKPETKSLDATGRIRFLGHSEKGARRTASICRRLRFGNRATRFVSILVDEHLRPVQLTANGEAPSRRALYRFFRDLGEAAPACLILALADGAAAAAPRLRPEDWAGSVAYMAFVLAEGERQRETAPPKRRLVTGRDLIDTLGLEPGPELGRVLTEVEEAVGAGEIAIKDEALALATRLAASPPATASPSPQAERGIEGVRS